jgi:hypothetical protein
MDVKVVKPNRKFLSLSGTITILHLSVFLLLLICSRSFVSRDGTIHPNDENRDILRCLEIAGLISTFPLGWIADWSNPIGSALLIAANSALIGLTLSWIIRPLLSRLVDNTKRHPIPHT